MVAADDSAVYQHVPVVSSPTFITIKIESAYENKARAKPACTLMLLSYHAEMKEPNLAAGIKRDDENVFSI